MYEHNKHTQATEVSGKRVSSINYWLVASFITIAEKLQTNWSCFPCKLVSWRVPIFSGNSSFVSYIQLKLETSKSQGLANITRGIRKSTHPKVVFSMLLKYNMPLETLYMYVVTLHHTIIMSVPLLLQC